MATKNPIALYAGNLKELQSGDQLPATALPALTGDVTTSVGTVATTIAAGVVTLAKMANIATASFIGRTTAGTGVPEALSIAQAKTMLNLTGTNSGDQTITLTGDVTGSGTGSFAATLATTVPNAHTFTGTVTHSAPTLIDDYTLNTDMTIWATGTDGSDTTAVMRNIVAYTNDTSSVTGTIKIMLPVLYTGTMQDYEIEINGYSDTSPIRILLTGYNPASAWLRTAAIVTGDDGGRVSQIRFGNDGANACILIGTTASIWAYPKVTVNKVSLAYSNQYNASWRDKSLWSITVITSEAGITVDTTPTVNRSALTANANNFAADQTISSANAALFLNAAASGNSCNIWMQTAGVARWRIIKSTTAEGGANSGSNLAISNYDDAGTLIGTPFSINRATGNVTFTGNIGNGTTATTISIRANKLLTGATTMYGIASDGQIQSDVTASARYFSTNANTQAASFTNADVRHYEAAQGTIGAGSAITVQYGFIATASLSGAGTNYGFYSNLAAAATSWNFHAAGTAKNYFSGSVMVGSVTDNGYKFEVTGSSNFTSAVSFGQNLTMGASNAAIEIGASGSSNAPLIDFHSGATGVDYDSRISGSGGSGSVGGGTLTYTAAAHVFAGGTVKAPTATTSIASFNAPHGVAPTSPVNGDMWTTAAGVFAQISSKTIALNNFYTLASSVSGTYYRVAQKIGNNGQGSCRINITGLLGSQVVNAEVIVTKGTAADSACSIFSFGRLYPVWVRVQFTAPDMWIEIANISGSSGELNVKVEDVSGFNTNGYTAVNFGAASTGATETRFQPVGVAAGYCAAYALAGSGTVTPTVAYLGQGTSGENWGELKNYKVVTPVATVNSAGLNIGHGTEPTSPQNGDVWTTTSGMFAMINSAIVGPFVSAAGGASWGTLTGTMSSQTDLQAALDARSTIGFDCANAIGLIMQ